MVRTIYPREGTNEQKKNKIASYRNSAHLNGQHGATTYKNGTLQAHLFIFCTRGHERVLDFKLSTEPNRNEVNRGGRAFGYNTSLVLLNGLFYADDFPFLFEKPLCWSAFPLNHCFHFHFNYPASFRAHDFNGILLKISNSCCCCCLFSCHRRRHRQRYRCWCCRCWHYLTR